MASKKQESGYDTIVYYRRWAECLRGLPPTLRLAIHDAIDNYIIDQTEPMEDIVRFSPYAQIVADIEADKKRYANTCEKRAEAGRKGAQSRYNNK